MRQQSPNDIIHVIPGPTANRSGRSTSSGSLDEQKIVEKIHSIHRQNHYHQPLSPDDQDFRLQEISRHVDEAIMAFQEAHGDLIVGGQQLRPLASDLSRLIFGEGKSSQQCTQTLRVMKDCIPLPRLLKSFFFAAVHSWVFECCPETDVVTKDLWQVVQEEFPEYPTDWAHGVVAKLDADSQKSLRIKNRMGYLDVEYQQSLNDKAAARVDHVYAVFSNVCALSTPLKPIPMERGFSSIIKARIRHQALFEHYALAAMLEALKLRLHYSRTNLHYRFQFPSWQTEYDHKFMARLEGPKYRGPPVNRVLCCLQSAIWKQAFEDSEIVAVRAQVEGYMD